MFAVPLHATSVHGNPFFTPAMSLPRPLTFVFLTALAACSGSGDGTAITAPPVVTPPADLAPALSREMRGLWVATVANIDWPSRNTLTADQQRAELVDILDRAEALGLNAVILQVRPAGDALYTSALEPWASLLAGQQGKDPGYDPLAFAVTEAHARGLELHAWINPFRAGNTSDSAKLVAPHLFVTRRDLVRVYGANLWFDPGEQAVQDHSMKVIADIVRRYDIDAIHADDYFYPYQVNDAAGKLLAFPDDGSYSRSGSALSRDDWRRANIDRFVERMYREVHAIKPGVKVGLSPFGIWRPGNPAGVTGLDAFASIYADSRKWLQQGWVDYLAPQLYWSIASTGQSFPLLLDWWMAQSTLGRHVWPGLAVYRVADGTSSAFSATEIPDQVRLARSRTPNGGGHLLYNTNTTFKGRSGANAASLAPLYMSRAVVPAYPWLDTAVPGTPVISVSGKTVQILPGSGAGRFWAIRSHTTTGWSTRVVFGDQRLVTLGVDPDQVVVNAVSQAGALSADGSWKR
jgi:uncharacterized lipoprotein YddW (UPF0748 family)